MKPTPLIHPTSERLLASMMKDLPQALLLTGPVGVGLYTIAQYIGHSLTKSVLTVLPEKDDKVDIDKGVITVKSVRGLYEQTRTRQAHPLVVIIDYAERMGLVAQNAFLKLLEEPGPNTHFILVTHAPEKLLPTIHSRVQHLDIRPLTRQQSQSYLDTIGDFDAHKQAQLLFMASGLPAELYRLAKNNDYFSDRSTIVRDARELLQGTTYGKLVIAHAYKDDRDRALQLLSDASLLLRRSLQDSPRTTTLSQLEPLLYAQQQIAANGNIRLCLARLVV